MLVYLTNGSAQTSLRAATLRQKLQTTLSTSPGRPVPALNLQRHAPGRVTTGVPIFYCTRTNPYGTNEIRTPDGGRNSSVGSAWARCPQRRGFDPPLGTFCGRGDFSLGVNMGSNSIPPKTLSDESINRGLVCAHMHFIARTQKILTFMS